MVLCVHAEGSQPIQLSTLLSFSTGCKSLPPMNFDPVPSLAFLHENELFGSRSRYPKANTCQCILRLPMCYDTYEEFVNAVNFGIQNAHGFGFA